MTNKVVLASLSMDLKRVALGYQRNSLQMAKKFYEEALLRKNEVDTSTLKPYMQLVLQRINTLTQNPNDTIAEDALLLSILVQNYAQTCS